VLRHLLRQGAAQDVLDAARRAGRELVEGDMSAGTLATVSRDVVTLEECMRMQNEGYRKVFRQSYRLKG